MLAKPRYLLILQSLFFIVFTPICHAQNSSTVDTRDGQPYRTTKIGNTSWMIDNLNYTTPNSVGVTKEEVDKYVNFELKGRYYHFEELDSVCPSGWQLPNVDDWRQYFQFLADKAPDVDLEEESIEGKNHHISFLNYNGKIDLFEKGNPLNLHPTGRIEGNVFNIPDVYADYWTIDSLESYAGRSHIHIMNVWTTIHSHKHHLKPKQKKKLRKFMVRCVKE